MFIVKRREGQWVRIGNAVVKVMETKSGSVLLGIEAPPEVPIERSHSVHWTDRPREDGPDA